MTLREFIDEYTASRRTITVFAPEQDDALESYFEARNVTVEHELLPDDGSGGFVVVTDDGEFAGSVATSAVHEFVSPTQTSPDVGSDETVRIPLNLLADTTFVALEKRQLLLASREIEDRAYRHGRGTLQTGFQSLSALRDQYDVYETLAQETSLDVHIYGQPDWSPDLPNATIHTEEAAEIGSYWFVVFDGGDSDQQACALVAEEIETDPGSFRGFWTYDPETVEEIDTYLSETYG